MQFTRKGNVVRHSHFISSQLVKAMRLTALFLTLFLVQVSARTTAQTVSFTAKGVTLEKAFAEIKKQTGMLFFYSPEEIAKAKTVSVDLENYPIAGALEILLKDQPLEYVIRGNTIFVKAKAITADLSQGPPSPQPPISVHGRVTDSVGNPLAGASVKVKGVAGKGAITDENGEFWISQVDNNAVLVIEFIGYEKREVGVANHTELTAFLHIVNKELAEVAIQSYSSGYQSISRERAAGSYVTVSNTQYNRSSSPQVLSRLDGIVSGMLFTKNSATGTELSVRGVSTLFANNQPLIVVDNFPYYGDINNLNPNDVENITVLRDANAASIWGVQSGNGVIVITTKKGKRNAALKVQANMNLTLTGKPNLFYSRNYMSASDFIDVEKQLFAQNYYDAKLTDPYHSAYSPVVQILADQKAGLITAADANAKIDALRSNDIRNDLTNYFYRPSSYQQYAVNFSGGSRDVDYYFSAGYDRSLPSLSGNTGERITLNSNNNFHLTKNLVLSAAWLYTQNLSQNTNNVSEVATGGSYVGIYPYARLTDASGAHLPIVKRYSSSWVNDPAAQAGRLNWRYVPLDEMGRTEDRSNNLDNKLNFGLRYSFLDMFSLDAKYQFQVGTAKSSTYYKDSSFYARDLYNSFYNPSGPVTEPIPKGGIYTASNRTTTSHLGRLQLGFNKTIHTDHAVSAIIGAEISQIKSVIDGAAPLYGYSDQSSSFIGVDFYNKYIQYPSSQFASIPNTQGSVKYTDRYISYFSNASYTYKGKYTLSGSGRIDKSNLFGVSTNQKSVPLYSIGGLWNVSKESFYHLSWLPSLKFRMSYGYNGNVNKSVTAVTTIGYTPSNFNIFPGTPFAQVQTIGNPLLRWEKVAVYNFGIDFALKGNVISGTLEYYKKSGIDIFGISPLAPTTGASTFMGNTANLTGNGWNVTLNATPINTPAFKWTINTLFNNENNTVSKYLQKATALSLLNAGASSLFISPFEGKPVYGIYSFPSGPLNNTGYPQGYVGGKLSTDYASIIGKATPDSLKYNGSARPTIYGSFMNTFTYKSVSISFNVVYKFDYYFRRSSINYSSLYSSWSMNADYDARWKQPGDEQRTFIPSMPTLATLNSNSDYFYTYSDKLIDKGDHLRLQDISLSYDVNAIKWSKGLIKKLRIYSYINNVGILWRANKDHLDPDIYGNGYPAQRSYSIGVQASF